MKTHRLVGMVLVLGMIPAYAGAAGVQDLDRVLFDRPYVEVLGASPAGVLYKVSRPIEDTLREVSAWVKPATAPAYEVSLDFKRLAGDKIFGTDKTYQYIGTPVTKRCDDVPPPASPAQRYDGAGLFASFGWISEDGDRVEVSPTGCRVTARYPGPGDYALIAMDDTGWVTITSVGDQGDQQLTYHSYADPTHPRVIADGGHVRYLGAVALAGTAVTWAHLDYDQQPPASSFVVRSSTDGSVPPTATRIPGWVVGTAIAGGATGWSTCQRDPCTAGSIAANGTQTSTTGTHTIVGVGNRFVFDTQQPTPGIEEGPAIGGSAPRTRLADVALLPPIAHAVAIGAGGVAYSDTQPAADSVNRRTYTRSGSTVTLSAQTRLGTTVKPLAQQMVARDGRRTAFVDEANVLWLVGDDGVRTRVFAGADRVEVVIGPELRLSGSRLLWWKGVYDGDRCDMRPPPCEPLYNRVPMLYDLRTGVSTVALPPLPGYGMVKLWGNYLAWTGASSTIWRRDLASGAVVQVKPAGTASVNGLAVHGDYVAWSTCTTGGSSPCGSSVVAHRNMTTRAAPIQLVSANTTRVELSGGHVVYDTSANGFPPTGTLKVNRLGTSATGIVGPIRLYPLSFDVHDETLTWIAPDDVARIGPNSPFVDYPKYLGNGSAPPAFDPALRVWNPEFGISKALPTCTLTIRSGTTVRRTLSCATPNGSARAVWDGRDSAGRLVPRGAYSWTLTGRDSDGTLRWWTGATHPITGTVRVV
ncbi:hypothetical protein [Kribbella sp. NPDC051770]|uniref:hypothetical protein n=1 Tax=Kribbella sp. NPDC051770 TaxID=3155413 RepID=UPI003440AABB